jgi:type I restriction enzyme M protein
MGPVNTNDIVQRLWTLCNVLRDDGVTYHQYVTELTYLLFLKMTQETETEGQLPEGYRWSDLSGKEGVEQLEFYRGLLVHLGSHGSPRVQAIFANASTVIKQPRNLTTLVRSIGDLDWHSVEREQLGDLYEGLLEKNASEKKSGAGQYFTPRPLIEAMVRVMQPAPGEIVQDPACGTGGFLIAADRYIKERTDQLFALPEQLQLFQQRKAFVGVELVQDAHRLALMNMMLHDIDSDVVLGDTLSPDGEALPRADVVLTNPPFGTKKGGGTPTRTDFTFLTSNKQLAFLQHVYRALVPGGRAAVVVPDNVLFEENAGTEIRRDLMEKCDLHTVLRLPTGIFYAQGVKTNVLFFTRGATDKGNTRATWVYDLRTNMPSFGKRTPLGVAHFEPFVAAYGAEPKGTGARRDEGEEGRFRCFAREWVKGRGDNLDISWLRDESAGNAEDLPEPEELVEAILERLAVATEEMRGLRAALGVEEEAVGRLEVAK